MVRAWLFFAALTAAGCTADTDCSVTTWAHGLCEDAAVDDADVAEPGGGGGEEDRDAQLRDASTYRPPRDSGDEEDRDAQLRDASTYRPPRDASGPPAGCCKVCRGNVKPCGDTCIRAEYTCHTTGGCACSG
jgi:hypothetical protein